MGMRAIALAAAVVVAGCSHNFYAGEFDALTSSGQPTTFLVEWSETRRKIGWLPWGEENTRIGLHARCSQRTVEFVDRQGADAASQCAPGAGAEIQFCGNPNADVRPDGSRLGAGALCGTITDADGASRILDLDDDFQMTLSCRPKSPMITIGGKTIRRDYLAARETPYEVTVSKLGEAEWQAKRDAFAACED